YLPRALAIAITDDGTQPSPAGRRQAGYGPVARSPSRDPAPDVGRGGPALGSPARAAAGRVQVPAAAPVPRLPARLLLPVPAAGDAARRRPISRRRHASHPGHHRAPVPQPAGPPGSRGRPGRHRVRAQHTTSVTAAGLSQAVVELQAAAEL